MPDPHPAPYPAAESSRSERERGDAACWLGELCPDCGALTEPPGAACWRCATDTAREPA